MIETGIVLGLGFLGLIFLGISANLNPKEHWAARLMCLVFALLISISIAAYFVQNQEVCDVVITSQNVTGNNTQNGYELLCFSTPSNHSETVFQLIGTSLVLLLGYAFMYLLWKLGQYMRSIRA